MEEALNQNLFKLVAIMEAAGIGERRIAGASTKNYGFFDHVRKGGGYTVRTYDGIVQWISDNWPERCIWPKEIDRPTPKVKDTQHGK